MKLCHALWLVVCVVLCACASPIVGAECAPGYTLCGHECVDLSADFRNCGACGNDCGLFVCEEGVCGAVLRPQANDASVSSGGDASVVPGPDASFDLDAGFSLDSGLTGCNLGEQQCSGGCANTQVDRNNCGACDNACQGNELCSGGSCNTACEDPLTRCGNRCVNLATDVENCGGCGNVCPSGICEDGECIGVVPGFVVVVGHDFEAGGVSIAMRRIAGNAVFLGRGSPVRVLTFRGEANAASVKGVEAAIDFVEAESGRPWQKVDAIEAIVPAQLQSADVFLIHAQAQARTSTLAKLGKLWGNALAQFVASGGVIVLFEAPSTRNDGTFRILEPASIFSAAGRDAIAKQALTVVAPGLGVTARVPTRYLSATNTVRFRALKTPGTPIVVDGNMDPVVVQRVVLP